MLDPVIGPELAHVLEVLGSDAHDSGHRLYLVGGAVRDALLGIPSTDIDVALAGDVISYARELASRWSALFPEGPTPEKPIVFRKYKTAKLLFPGEIAPGVSGLDFAALRSESYPESGKPPILSDGDLRADLLRRDFSINALALALSPDEAFTVIDTVGGINDLRQRVLRVLHPQSFVDDPARVLRGLRFQARFDCAFEPETARLVDDAIRGGYLGRLPRHRLFDEFRKALEERDPLPVLKMLERPGVLRQIHPEFSLERLEHGGIFAGGPSAQIPPWKIRLRMLGHALTDSQFGDFLVEHGVPPREIPEWFTAKRGR